MQRRHFIGMQYNYITIHEATLLRVLGWCLSCLRPQSSFLRRHRQCRVSMGGKIQFYVHACHVQIHRAWTTHKTLQPQPSQQAAIISAGRFPTSFPHSAVCMLLRFSSTRSFPCFCQNNAYAPAVRSRGFPRNSSSRAVCDHSIARVTL